MCRGQVVSPGQSLHPVRAARVRRTNGSRGIPGERAKRPSAQASQAPSPRSLLRSPPGCLARCCPAACWLPGHRHPGPPQPQPSGLYRLESRAHLSLLSPLFPVLGRFAYGTAWRGCLFHYYIRDRGVRKGFAVVRPCSRLIHSVVLRDSGQSGLPMGRDRAAPRSVKRRGEAACRKRVTGDSVENPSAVS